MKIVKNIIAAIADPVRKINGAIDNDRLAKFFNRHPIIIYLFALISTMAIFFFVYFFDKIWG